jgi:hypothetical protein
VPDLRLAIRLLRKQPIVTLTTVFALAVGIGMATTSFTLLDAVLFSRLPARRALAIETADALRVE